MSAEQDITVSMTCRRCRTYNSTSGAAGTAVALLKLLEQIHDELKPNCPAVGTWRTRETAGGRA